MAANRVAPLGEISGCKELQQYQMRIAEASTC